MLILSRDVEESIVIADGDIVIKILGIKNGETVQIGIQAHPSIRVDRLEIHRRRLAEGSHARPPQRLTWEDPDTLID